MQFSSAQTNENQQLSFAFDVRLLNHYTEEELIDMRANNLQKYKVVEYYYTQSYIFEKVVCTECVSTDASTFDISRYEELRQKSVRVEHVFTKYGFKITLLSRDELLLKTPYQIFKDQ